MNPIVSSLIVLATFIFMEFVAWFTHKFVMHGFLWSLHRDHHQVTGKIFQLNDFFFIIFAVPSMILILFGTYGTHQWLLFIGLGILLYGLAYFFVHEIIIHQRIRLFRYTKNPYFVGLRKAHKAHHKKLEKEEGLCFGMLAVPFRYFKI